MSVTNFIIIGVVIMLLLACGIIFFVILYQRRVIKHQHELKTLEEQKQQELIQASIQGEEEERMRIASELHDDVGATLSSVRLFLHSAAKKDADPAILAQSRQLLDDSINKIRNISHTLQPALLQQLGLQAALESFAAMISNTGTVRMSYTCPVQLPRMDEHIELSIYRIMQELTGNLLRHAQATVISAETILVPGGVQTIITHNGDGITDEAYQSLIYKKGSIGLKNIVNRLKSIKARISFTRPGDAYYCITVTSPLSL